MSQYPPRIPRLTFLHHNTLSLFTVFVRPLGDAAASMGISMDLSLPWLLLTRTTQCLETVHKDLDFSRWVSTIYLITKYTMLRYRPNCIFGDSQMWQKHAPVNQQQWTISVNDPAHTLANCVKALWQHSSLFTVYNLLIANCSGSAIDTWFMYYLEKILKVNSPIHGCV